jgi:hypothetical protein
MPTVAGGERTNTRRMRMLRAQFFEAGKALDAKGDPEANCWLCKQRIDYQAAPNSTDASHNLDHYHTVKDHPELQEDPTNFRHSHKLCNGERKADAPSLGLGEQVPDWW